MLRAFFLQWNEYHLCVDKVLANGVAQPDAFENTRPWSKEDQVRKCGLQHRVVMETEREGEGE